MDCSRSAKVASSPPRPASQGQRGRAHADSSSSSDARLRSSQIASFARSKRPSSYASRSSPSTRSSSSARRSAHATRSHAARRTRARSRVALSRRRRSPDHRERWHDARRLARGSRRDRRRDPPRERARQRHSRRARLADDRGERALHRRPARSPSDEARVARDAALPWPPRAATVPPRGIRGARVAHRQLARIRGSPSRAALGGARVHRVGGDVRATAIAHASHSSSKLSDDIRAPLISAVVLAKEVPLVVRGCTYRTWNPTLVAEYAIPRDTHLPRAATDRHLPDHRPEARAQNGLDR